MIVGGSVIEVIDEHRKRTRSPIDVIVDGSVIEVRDEHLSKTLSQSLG